MLPALLFGQNNLTVPVQVGAQIAGAYLPLLHGKRVAVVANQTSVLDSTHLVDFLVSEKINLVKVFAPEHGFRGTASAGEVIKDGKDVKTGLPIVSLYGKNKKPSAEMLANVDVVLFDLQDVGARFYTYISTLNYVMEACAENGKKIIVLDRPNPNGYYVDGPVLKEEFKSFVGMNPVPVVHGMTIGEYAKMIKGEGWINESEKCNLDVVRCQGWTHSRQYELPIAPSPNLPNDIAIALYPSLCFFEGTTVSVGRGTDKPFQIIGAPYFKDGEFNFTPKANEGAKHPKYEGVKCNGFDLSDFAVNYISGLGNLYLYWLVDAYNISPDQDAFFTNFFDKLAGTDQLRKDIINGLSPDEIRDSWQDDLDAFHKIRSKYLLYADYK